MTYGDAIAAGYKEVDTAYARGYISRRTDIATQPVRAAGGKRKGLFYVETPAYNTTQYHIRQYLAAPAAA